jgi:putative transposase
VARLARVVAIDIPHHVTQRGNARQRIFESDADHLVYLDLLQQHCALHALSLIGYCLMSNHVHLIVIPRQATSLPLTLKHTHGRFAAYFNARHASSGHVWQGRYYSCPLDPPHLWAALRYTELNPVRAGMIAGPDEYRWSSAAAHCGAHHSDILLDIEPWRTAWEPAAWCEHLATAEAGADADAIRRSTHTGRPLGHRDFVAQLEKTLQRRLTPEKGGRPPKRQALAGQQQFGFGQL